MKTALLIVDHGSRLQAANDMLDDVVDVLRNLSSDMIIHAAHMELCEPTIEEGVDRCVADGAESIIVFPYMLSPGRHATEDIPQMAEEAVSRHPGVSISVTEPFGVHQKLAEVVLERAGVMR
jgi:sirohydrochlorin ferrochelatase